MEHNLYFNKIISLWNYPRGYQFKYSYFSIKIDRNVKIPRLVNPIVTAIIFVISYRNDRSRTRRPKWKKKVIRNYPMQHIGRTVTTSVYGFNPWWISFY